MKAAALFVLAACNGVLDIEKPHSGETNLAVWIDRPPMASAGTNLMYTIKIANEGPDQARALKLVDIVPEGAGVTSAYGDGWSCGPEPGGATCMTDGLDAGYGSTIAITALLPADAITVTNSVTLTSATSELDDSNNTAVDMMQIVPQADLALGIVSEPTATGLGSAYGYEIDVTNMGPGLAPHPVVELSVSAGQITSGTGDGWSCTISSLTTQPATCTRDVLVVGTSTIAIGMVAPDYAPSLPAMIHAHAGVTSDAWDPVMTNNLVDTATTVN